MNRSSHVGDDFGGDPAQRKPFQNGGRNAVRRERNLGDAAQDLGVRQEIRVQAHVTWLGQAQLPGDVSRLQVHPADVQTPRTLEILQFLCVEQPLLWGFGGKRPKPQQFEGVGNGGSGQLLNPIVALVVCPEGGPAVAEAGRDMGFGSPLHNFIEQVLGQLGLLQPLPQIVFDLLR